MMPVIAIIGGGISGTFVVMECLRQATKPLRILWFDRNDLFCRGLAYSTTEEAHLLNVRASNMSVFADEPVHFINWLKSEGYSYTGNDFVPRRIYGLYVSSTLEKVKQKNPLAEVVQLPQEVTSLVRETENFRLKAVEEHSADAVVLAIGNFLPGHPRSQTRDFITSPWYFQNAFDKRVLDKQVLSKRKITIIGAGLTMIDMVMALKHRNYTGLICTISPHGYLPEAHQQPVAAAENFIDPEIRYNLSEVFALVKQQLKSARREGRNPYGVIDALRPHVQRLWLSFSIHDQRQFLRHLRHKWGVARHRAPEESISVIHDAIDSGGLKVLKGRIDRIEMCGEKGFRLFYRNETGSDLALDTDVIINCTGPEPDFNKVEVLLVKQLINSGLIEGHDLAYGLKAPANGRLSEGFFTIGPPLKGVLWESTAVPEIRLQAAALAGKLF